MKTYSGTLATFLLNAKSMVRADLYAITLNGGTVLRWTGADQVITYGGNTYLPGPKISDGGVKQKRGLGVDTFDVTLIDDGNTKINTVPLLTFARKAGFDGATVVVTRVYAADWRASISGGYTRFSGRISEVRDISKTQMTMVCSSWLELLNVQMPTNLISSGCINTLYGSACGLARATYTNSGAVSTGTNGATTFSTNLGQATGYFDLGYILFTSGANNGLQRTVKTFVSGGNVTVVSPFPSAPANGDTFTITAGCTHTQAICSSKFNNLANFRGFPYVPPPETAT